MIIDPLKSFFTFSKRELNGLLVFCSLLIMITLTPLIYRWGVEPEIFSFAEFKKDIEAFKASEQKQSAYSYSQLKEEVETKELEPQYFEFNPNSLSADSWHRLGLSDKQIKNIKNYESKGGHFYRKEDLQKIYSISKEDYSKLEPYIIIPERFPKKPKSEALPGTAERAATEIIVVELNTADSVQLETIRGIGPAFASRIIKYRNRLGGFYSKEQLKEVYGIDAVKYDQLQNQVNVDQSFLRKININTATFEDMRTHPYLSYKQINAIIQYRKQHGSYLTLNDLKKVLILNDEILNKIGPYLNFE